MSILHEFNPDLADDVAVIPSPCVGICRMDPVTDWCAGCYRSIPEITVWSTASRETKLGIWRQIQERML